MSELKRTVLKMETVEASDAQKFHMLVKSIELLNEGKTAEQAHSFVLTLLKDGYYDKYSGGTAKRLEAKEAPLQAKTPSPELAKQDGLPSSTEGMVSENLQASESDIKSGSGAVSEKVQEENALTEQEENTLNKVANALSKETGEGNGSFTQEVIGEGELLKNRPAPSPASSEAPDAGAANTELPVQEA